MKSIVPSFSLTWLVVASLASLDAAPATRLYQVGASRFVADAAVGRDLIQRGWIDAAGRFEIEQVEPVLSTVVVPAAARNKIMMTRDMLSAYRRLGPQAMVNFLVDETGEYHLIGNRDYLPIAISPSSKIEVGLVPNLSTRGRMTPGGPLIGGFVVMENPREVLIRVVGPGLAAFGVASPAEDPSLTLYRGDRVFDTNDNWSESLDVVRIRRATGVAGAFPLVEGSKDAVYVDILQPGAYTVHAYSAAPGEVLVEVYLLP